MSVLTVCSASSFRQKHQQSLRWLMRLSCCGYPWKTKRHRLDNKLDENQKTFPADFTVNAIFSPCVTARRCTSLSGQQQTRNDSLILCQSLIPLLLMRGNNWLGLAILNHSRWVYGNPERPCVCRMGHRLFCFTLLMPGHPWIKKDTLKYPAPMKACRTINISENNPTSFQFRGLKHVSAQQIIGLELP